MTIQNQKPIQIKLAVLEKKGWTITALSEKLGQTVNTLEKWKKGQRNPANERAVMEMLDRIEKLKRIPKKRRYAKGSRKPISNEV